jgi:SAM-dependent methyltransferase
MQLAKPVTQHPPVDATSRNLASRYGQELSRLFQKFVRANRRICVQYTPEHYRESNVFNMYTKIANILFAQSSISRVVDAGAGKRWRFPSDYKSRFDLHLIGVDIDFAEMAMNDTLDEKYVSDVCKSIPVAPGSVDLITAYSGLEHFEDTGNFLQQCFLALRPGGLCIAQFPGRYAPFAVLNRCLPHRVTKFLLANLRPGSEGALGFRAYYDRTNYSAFVRMAKTSGFEVEYYLPGFFSSGYFAFFIPIYIVSIFFDLLRFSAGAKNLASYNLFVLRKPGPSDGIIYS